MATQMTLDLIIPTVAAYLKIRASTIHAASVSGGSINHAYRLALDDGRILFLKVNHLQPHPQLLSREKSSLDYLERQHVFIVPSVRVQFSTGHYQFLLMTWIEEETRTTLFWKRFGEQLARLHQIENDRYGFHEDNFMGSLPQRNQFADNWIDFFITMRLDPLARSARDKGLLSAKNITSFDQLYAKLPFAFDIGKPCLLHGDLWSGNFMCDGDEQPILIDPGVYFGHRSIDLGMTQLFGGFDKIFYDSYNYYFRLPTNYQDQWHICNLYPLLIHLHLFGRAYFPAIEGILKNFTD